MIIIVSAPSVKVQVHVLPLWLQVIVSVPDVYGEGMLSVQPARVPSINASTRYD